MVLFERPGSWEAARLEGLSSSDLAVLLGKSVYRSPWALAREKRLEEPVGESEINENMFWGDAMEPIVAQEWSRRTGLALFDLVREPVPTRGADPLMLRDRNGRRRALYVNRENPILRTTPDYFGAVEDDGVPRTVIEVKTTGNRDKWQSGPPQNVLLQCQWHMLVTGLPSCVVPVLFFSGSRQLQVYKIDVHPAFASPHGPAAKAALEWWERFVVKGERPEVCGLDLDFLKQRHPYGNGTTVYLDACLGILDDEYTERREELTRARKTQAKAARRYRDVQARLRALIGDATFAEIHGRPGVLYQLAAGRAGTRRLTRRQKR